MSTKRPRGRPREKTPTARGAEILRIFEARGWTAHRASQEARCSGKLLDGVIYHDPPRSMTTRSLEKLRSIGIPLELIAPALAALA